jgi:hypothetical protein
MQHRDLAAGRWHTLSLAEQMAHVGSEVERTISWRSKGNEEIAMRAFDRALELADLTLADPKHQGRRKEIARVREGLVDHFLCDNEYGSDDQDWRRYFLQFAVAARAGR